MVLTCTLGASVIAGIDREFAAHAVHRGAGLQRRLGRPILSFPFFFIFLFLSYFFSACLRSPPFVPHCVSQRTRFMPFVTCSSGADLSPCTSRARLVPVRAWSCWRRSATPRDHGCSPSQSQGFYARHGRVDPVAGNHQSLNVGSVQPPQTQGKVQSAVRLALSGIYLLQASARTGLTDCQTISNVPKELILPIITGFERW